MKTYGIDRLPKLTLSTLVTLLLGFVPIASRAASHGELDPTFDPLASEIPEEPTVFAIGKSVYLHGFTEGLFRFHENGRLDPAWKLNSPIDGPIIGVAPTPSGGWLVSGFGALFGYQVFGDGTYQRISGSWMPSRPFFPQEDGAVIVADLGFPPKRFLRDGTKDPTYPRIREHFVATSFFDGQGAYEVGGPSLILSQDSRGRVVLGGNFLKLGGHERFGLVRLNSDGIVDPSWNPGIQLGAGEPGVPILSAIPRRISAGPSNSTVVVLAYYSTNGVPSTRIAHIAEDGSVLNSFGSPSYSQIVSTVVQPDNQILVAGTFTNWLGHAAKGIVRIGTNGTVGPTFNVTLTRTNGAPSIGSMALDGYGRLVFWGNFDSVNQSPRPGLARVIVYDPQPTAPAVTVVSSQPRIATNEVLYLSADVAGYPEPSLQWYRNGVALPGETSRAIRVPVGHLADVGNYQLMAANAVATNITAFPFVALAERSPRRRATNDLIVVTSTNQNPVNHLVSLPDGKILVGRGTVTTRFTNSIPMIERLLPDGSIDSEFGIGGSVVGNGFVDTITVLPNGNMLIAGGFSELAGAPASGIAELTPAGVRVDRPFPKLDTDTATSIVELPTGGFLVAGTFEHAGPVETYRMAKLSGSLQVDPAFRSPVKPWQLVDALTLDTQGRVLAAGIRIRSEIVLTNPVLFGLQRLLADGSADPGFHVAFGATSTVLVEQNGTLLVGPPMKRLSADGELMLSFDFDSQTAETARFGLGLGSPDHTMVRSWNGGVVFPARQSSGFNLQLVRFDPNGRRDYTFDVKIDLSVIQAMTSLPDGSLFLAIQRFGVGSMPPVLYFATLPADPDSQLMNLRKVDGTVTADVATQPGRFYEIYRTSSLDPEAPATLVAEVEGDGYVQTISAPANGDVVFLKIKRR